MRPLYFAIAIAALGFYLACGKSSDSDETAVTTDTIGTAPVGKLAISCGGKSCVGTEGN